MIVTTSRAIYARYLPSWLQCRFDWFMILTQGCRICYFTSSYPFGGGESFIDPEIRAWEGVGIGVDVLPLYPRGSLRDDALGLCGLTSLPLFSPRYLVALLGWLIENPVKVCCVVLDLLRAPSKIPKNISAALKAFYVAKLLRERRPCHIHAHWGGASSTMAMVVGDMLCVPWSLTCHRWDIYENNLLALES